ncbi:MAG TPA: NAD(P)H-binding protein [Anaerolineales bacterium]|nr:NAD(P)H-binding protein [Anaerolineales bacterium]
MILVTGGTGFIGKPLLRMLNDNGLPVRVLVKPSTKTPDLPKGVPLDIAVSNLSDQRALRPAFKGVDTIIHLASAESLGAKGNMLEVDAIGTKNLVDVAADAKVKRFIFISQLGADRASYYPALKVKGIAEDHIRKSGIPFIILRSAMIYGPQDHFTVPLSRLIKVLPFIFLPGGGNNLLQPIGLQDVLTCLLWSLEPENLLNQTLDIAGAEYLSFNQIVDDIENTIGVKKRRISVSLPRYRSLTLFLAGMIRGVDFSTYWVDQLSYDRTCPVDSVLRNFGFLPARFSYSLDYLKPNNQ